jgi:hypothetical protein
MIFPEYSFNSSRNATVLGIEILDILFLFVV